jgi:hypothetical protein
MADVSDGQDDSRWEAFVTTMLANGHATEGRSRYSDKSALFTGSREIAHLEPPPPEGGREHVAVTWSPHGFTWGWEDTRPGLDRVLWPVAWSAAGLLVRGPLERIRERPGDGNCGWLFLDLSKNASRRWCEMRSCGNRAKARRHYAQTQADSRV